MTSGEINMEMRKDARPYRNNGVNYVKELFADIPKSKGKLVAITNGGYHFYNKIPNFGCRVYWDSKTGTYNCQVYSDINAMYHPDERIREYSVIQGEETSLESVLNAIFYNESCLRIRAYGK
jgi:hypothetical protein